MTESENTNDHNHGHGDAPSYDDINTPVVVLVGAISAIVTVVTIMFVQGLCYHWHNSFIRKRSTEPENMPAVAQIAEQKKMLEGGDGLTSIDAAIDKVVSNYGK